MQLQAQQQAESIREQSARDVQSAAQKAAARAFEVEAVRIRAEAEARLREETERARHDAQSQLEREVARLRTETEQRRAADIADVRAQVSQLQEAAKAAKAAPAPRIEITPPPAPRQHESFAEPDPDDNFVAANWVPAVGGAAPSAPGRWRTWAAGAGILGVAVVAGVVVLGRPATMRHTPPPAAESKPAESTPEITADLAPSRKATSRASAVRDTAAPTTGAAPAAAKSVGSGPATLTLFSRIPLDVIFEGKRIGTTEDGQLVVQAGAHTFELVSRRFGYRGELTLSLAPGQMLTHTVSLPSGVLRVRGAAGTEVFVEGEHVGALPLGDVSVPIGTREVVFRHPQQGERRQMIEVGASGPVEVTAMFGGAPLAPPPAESAATSQPVAPAPASAAPAAGPPRLAPLSAPRPRSNVQ